MRIQQKDEEVPTIVTIEDGVSLATTIVDAVAGLGGYEIAKSRGASEIGAVAIGAVASGLTSMAIDKGKELLSNSRYVPNKTQASQVDSGGPTSTRLNAIDDRYRKMWETRRRKYGKTGRRE